MLFVRSRLFLFRQALPRDMLLLFLYIPLFNRKASRDLHTVALFKCYNRIEVCVITNLPNAASSLRRILLKPATLSSMFKRQHYRDVQDSSVDAKQAPPYNASSLSYHY